MDVNKGVCWMATEESVVTETETKSDSNTALDNAVSRIEELETNVDKITKINKELIEGRDKAKANLRDNVEKVSKQDKELSEKDEAFSTMETSLKSAVDKADTLTTRLRNRDISSALSKALTEEGLSENSLFTASALVNKSDITYNEENGTVDMDSITKALENLKTNHSVLFQTKPNTPAVKRPVQDDTASDYITQAKKLAQLGDRKALEELKEQHGKT